MIEIKHCPFCGSPGKQPEDCAVRKPDGKLDERYGPWWQIMCSNEDCRAWRADESPEKVAAKWNMRAEQPNAALCQPAERDVERKNNPKI